MYTDISYTVNEINGVYEIPITSKEYPPIIKNRLRENAPKKLYLKGNIQLLNRYRYRLGFCSIRDYHPNSVMLAENIVKDAALTNTVVAGYTGGLDNIYHYTALKNGGSTICVLPQGFSSFHIKGSLRNVWNWSRVLVISQFSFDTPWTYNRAMQGASLVISLSNQMLLVEARSCSRARDAGNKTLAIGVPLTVITSKSILPFKCNDYISNSTLIAKGAIAYNVELTKHKTVVSDNLLCNLKAPITYTGPISTLGYRYCNCGCCAI